jgi:hypothetical protein
MGNQGVPMAAEQTAPVDVEEQQEDPEGERERSTIGFPYADLDNAIRIPKGVHQRGGLGCEIDQLAAQLNVSTKGGGYRQMLSAARSFGFVTFNQGSVRLTALGQQINDPTQEQTAKALAFLTVPLYKAVYDRFRGGTLPPNAGLENEMVNLGVVRKVVDRARQVFQRSAQQAGFFAHGHDRLVSPVVEVPDQKRKEQEKRDQKRHDDGGGGGDKHGSLLQGLINELPPDGTKWGAEDRVAWLRLATGIFDFVYEKADPITVQLANNSAKENAR